MDARRLARGRVAPLVALGVACALVAAVAAWVDLRPTIGAGFFFARDSAPLRQQRRIDELFGGQSQLVVIAKAPDITSEAYTKRIAALSGDLAEIPGVVEVKSVTRGPGDAREARESPLWRRLLLDEHGSATHVIALVRDPWPDSLVPRVRETVATHERDDFRLLLAGVPYAVAVMQEELVRDFAVFGAAAVLVFSGVALALFRSVRVAAGTLVSAIAAVAATLLGVQALGEGLGVLSANLVTIVFVLTQSHVVFLTSNAWNLSAEGRGMDETVSRAWRDTLRASTASAVTTLLGFGTLLFVQAEPLRELGVGGVMGTGAAFASAFLLYPPFLLGASPRPRSGGAPPGAVRRRCVAAVAIAAVAGVLGLGVLRLDTDPSLLDYFDADDVVHRGLEGLDRDGGSSPLELVLQRRDGEPLLDGDDAYEWLWNLQHDFETEPTVGRVLSLPVVLAEGRRFPLSFLLSDEAMVDLLETSLFGEVAERFVTGDHRKTLFLLQMVEHRRERPRLEVLETLGRIARARGFAVPLTGGIYALQGHLARQVAESLLYSLAALALLFTGVSWIAAGSLRAGLVMTGGLALVPLAVFGGMGWLGAPLDIVAAPAATVGLGLAADAILHLGVAARRAEGGALTPSAWAAGLRAQRAGILRATGIVAGGFALFAFSSFPPTRRFGLAVAASMAVAAIVALWGVPPVAALLARRRDGARRSRTD